MSKLVLINHVIRRSISTTTNCLGKRSFKKFQLINKRGTKIFKEKQAKDPYPDMPIDKRGVRDIGYTNEHGQFVVIPERIPELIVPDLKDFKLQPYVSYRVADVNTEEFTEKDLFNVVYKNKIIKDFEENNLNEDGSSKQPSDEEKLDSETAKRFARKTGSDIF